MREECYVCENTIVRDFTGKAVYCAGCGSLKDYDENRLNYCNKCDCYCGCHPCKHTKD